MALRIRTKQPEIRRDQLLDAAEVVFALKGAADVTVADVAEAAGVAKGTFYLYFPSKDHCLVALKERLAQGIVDRFLAVLAPEYDKMERGETDVDVVAVTRRLLNESFTYAIEHADVHRNLFHRSGNYESDQVAMKAEGTIHTTLTHMLKRMNQLGIAQVSYPEQTARILFSGVHWALEQSLNRMDQKELTDLKEAAVEIVVRSLSSRSE